MCGHVVVIAPTSVPCVIMKLSETVDHAGNDDLHPIAHYIIAERAKVLMAFYSNLHSRTIIYDV